MSFMKSLERKIAIVFNEKALKVNEKLENKFIRYEGSDLKIYVPKSIEELKDNLQEIIENDFEVLVSGGGDGTLFELINSIRNFNGNFPLFGVIKAGTGNGLAGEIGAKKSLRQIESLGSFQGELPIVKIPFIQVIADEKDVGLTINAGTGIDARVLNDYNLIKNSNKGKGLFGYLRAVFTKTIPGLIKYNPSNVKINFEGINMEGQRIQASYIQELTQAVVVGTSPYYGKSLKAFPYALNGRDDNLMNLRIVSGNTLSVISKILFDVYRVFKGTHKGAHIKDYLVSKVTVNYEESEAMQTMGEAQGHVKSISYKVSENISFIDYKKLKIIK